MSSVRVLLRLTACALVVALLGTMAAANAARHPRKRAVVIAGHLILGTTYTHATNMMPVRVRLRGTSRTVNGRVQAYIRDRLVDSRRLVRGAATLRLPSQATAGTTTVTVRYLGARKARPGHRSVAWRVISRPAPPADSSSLRIATYNIRAGVSTATFRGGVNAILPDADIVGLQETNSQDKEAVLYDLQSKGWSFHREVRSVQDPDHAGGAEQTPVLWRTARFDYDGSCHALSSGEPTDVRSEIPTWADGTQHWVQVVRLTDRLTGEQISIINVHLVDGAILAGVPRPNTPKAWALFKLQMHNLVATTRKELATGRDVYVLGDFNVGWVADHNHGNPYMPIKQFAQLGQRSMWASERPATTRGTHAHSLIDQVFSVRRAWASKVFFGIGWSDHYPAVATYWLHRTAPIAGVNTTAQPTFAQPVGRERATHPEPTC